MKNLAGCADADEVIREELYLAGITVVSVDKTRSEVPCTVIVHIVTGKQIGRAHV